MMIYPINRPPPSAEYIFPIFFLTLNPVKIIPIIIVMLAAAFAPLWLVSFPETGRVAAECEAAPRAKRARIVAAGDLMQHMPQVTAARRADGRYDYRESFRHAARYFREADLAIVNLETTLSDEGPYSGYPCFRSPSEVADAMRDMNIDLAVMANNHCCDRGASGIVSTTDILDRRGIARTGVFRDSLDYELNRIAYLKRGGIAFAVVNYTYGTNGIPVPRGTMVNMLDTAVMARDLASIDRRRADCVIAAVHWGNEYERRPNGDQRAVAAFLKRHGVDIIIGSHPHVVQPFEIESDGGPTFYSLGNFVSNQRKRYCDGGLMAVVDVTLAPDGRLSYEAEAIPVWVLCPKYVILPPEVGDTLRMNADARRAYGQFMSDTRELTGI